MIFCCMVLCQQKPPLESGCGSESGIVELFSMRRPAPCEARTWSRDGSVLVFSERATACYVYPVMLLVDEQGRVASAEDIDSGVRDTGNSTG